MATTKEILHEVLNKLEEIEEKIKPTFLASAPINKKKVLKEWPQIISIIWVLCTNGDIKSKPYSAIEKDALINGNIFRTEAQAKKEASKRKALYRIKKYIKENFGIFVPNWHKNTQEKHTIFYNYDDKNFSIENCVAIRQYSPYGYLRNKENAKQLIHEMEQDLLILHIR